MSNAISVHIGLNKIDKAVYGTDGALAGCHNDARAMQNIASSLGYKTTVLLDQDATAGNVIKRISDAAKALTSGDIFLLTYAGHGSQITDITSDEADGLDETWVLYDRMLIDDELFALWSDFKAGVRVLVVSDSCHSGTVVRDIYARLLQGDPEFQCGGYRVLDSAITSKVFDNMTSCYEPIKFSMRGDRVSISASVILLSGCQDNQLSGDGSQNGLFTSKLLEVWDGGNFSGDYEKFISSIKKRMPFSQVPNLYRTGVADATFGKQKPFSIDPSPSRSYFDQNVESDRVALTLHIDRAFIESCSEKDLLDFLRTDGAEVMATSYSDWKSTTSRLSNAVSSRGSWEVKCETNTKSGDTKCSGSVSGTF